MREHSGRSGASGTDSEAPAYPVVSADRYMLRSAVLRRLEHIAPAPNAAVRCRRARGAEAKQRLERGHGLLPPIVSKDELVQVDLQLRSAHAVIRPDQPLLEVPDGAVGQRDDRGGAFAKGRTRRLRPSDVSEVRFGVS